MSYCEGVREHWRERLDGLGLRSLSDLLADGDAPPPTAGRWEPLSKPGLGGRRRWRWTLDGENGGRPRVLFVKRYVQTPIRTQLDRIRRQSARHSRAWWEYQCALELAGKQIPVAAPVAFVEEMRGRFEHRSAVILEELDGDAFDRTWVRLREQNAAETRPPLRHDLARRLGRFVAAFHSTGLCHRDLYLCHIFLQLDPHNGAAPRFGLIDLARVHRPWMRRMRWLLKDLAQLDSSARQIGATRTDRLRTLLAYLGLQRRSRRTRWYVRRIQSRSDRILRRILAKSRT